MYSSPANTSSGGRGYLFEVSCLSSAPVASSTVPSGASRLPTSIETPAGPQVRYTTAQFVPSLATAGPYQPSTCDSVATAIGVGASSVPAGETRAGQLRALGRQAMSVWPLHDTSQFCPFQATSGKPWLSVCCATRIGVASSSAPEASRRAA